MVKNPWKSYGKFLVACSVFGAFIVSVPSTVAAKRLHDPQMEAKVQMNQTLTEGTTVSKERRSSLKDRVRAILEASQAEDMAAVEVEVEVPVTRSVYDTSIVGTPLASQQQCVKYLLRVNPRPNIAVSPEELVSYYYEEGKREGIRPDVAFVQALKETGFFRYGGTVTPDQNNYCGLGTTSETVKGAYFPSSKMGVRAHIQHLLAYASTRKPVEPVVDPRYTLVRSTYGNRTLGQWQDLNGRWAVPGNSYGQSILSMFRAMVNE